MKKKIDKKPKLVILIISLVFVLSLTQLFISFFLAVNGDKLRQLEEKASLLEQENKILSEEIYRLGSLKRINDEAKNLGFVKADKILSLTSQVPVALGIKELSAGR